jgi:CheY-like chemotaxis protein
MHGKVEVASEPGTGSEFSFTAQFGMPGSHLAQLDSPDQGLRDTGIILVDDNSDCRSILSELLRAQGAQVIEAGSAATALNEISRDVSDRKRSRIILLDARMPAPGGFELASRLANGARGRPPIVMMLGTNDLTNEVARLRAIGLNNYIVKPVRRSELFAAIARACEGVRLEPRGENLAPPAIAPAPSSPAPLDRRLRILMADDSPDNRALIRAYLKKTPYALEEAENGQEAIDKFIVGQFDLVLMDIQMPIVDGYQATSAIRGWERANNRDRTPIVALTASALEDAVQRTRAAGCDAHVTKPVRKSTLFDAIRDAMEGQGFKDAEERAEVIALREEPCRTG